MYYIINIHVYDSLTVNYKQISTNYLYEYFKIDKCLQNIHMYTYFNSNEPGHSKCIITVGLTST